jgi:hypothetical protein
MSRPRVLALILLAFLLAAQETVHHLHAFTAQLALTADRGGASLLGALVQCILTALMAVLLAPTLTERKDADSNGLAIYETGKNVFFTNGQLVMVDKLVAADNHQLFDLHDGLEGSGLRQASPPLVFSPLVYGGGSA